MKELKLVIGTILMFYVFPVMTVIAFAERAETTGHTELSQASGIDGNHPGDNYSVFRQGRYIHIVTGMAPAKIMEQDGKLVRTNTVMNKVLPVTTYRPATPAETALWRRYFS